MGGFFRVCGSLDQSRLGDPQNTPWSIGRYRELALAQASREDSYQFCDGAFSVMEPFQAFGPQLAWRLPLWSTVALALAIEVFVAYFIRDNWR